MQENGMLTKEELKKKLSEEEYYVTQEKGTERPFTGEYVNHHEKGMYTCTVCGNELFVSDAKFDSGTGWPSFDAPIGSEKIEKDTDASHGMIRTEVKCNKCSAHLGHIFNDGPTKTGERYCINSCSLKFKTL